MSDHRPKDSIPNSDTPVRFFTLDQKKVLPGDILLNTSPAALVSRAIRAITKSDYSHAAICSEPGFFVEAINVGVRRFLAHTLAAHNKSNLRVLRLRPTVQDWLDIGRRAGLSADGYVTRPYWKAGALTVLSRMISLSESGAFFCSHLVAQAYQEAGINLIEGRDPWKVVPGHLMDCALLEDVTDQVVREEDASVRYLARNFVEGSHRETPHDMEVGIKQAIHRRVAAAFREHKIDVPVDFDGVLTALRKAWKSGNATDIDALVYQVFHEEGLFRLPEKQFPSDSPTFGQAAMVAVGIEMKRWNRDQAEHLLEEFRQWHSLVSTSLGEARSASREFQAVAEEHGSEVFVAMSAMYGSHAGRLQVIEENVSASMDMLGIYLESLT